MMSEIAVGGVVPGGWRSFDWREVKTTWSVVVVVEAIKYQNRFTNM